MKTLGYLGLGVMGYGMTGNLIDKSGCDIYGYDPVPALRERFAARGGKVLDDAKTLYKTCDIIFMCLPTNAIVKATITEIMETARPGTTIVDMGSTSPYVIQELHAAGRTIIFVTHNPETAQYSSRNIVLRDGQVKDDKPNRNILNAAETLAALPKQEDD